MTNDTTQLSPYERVKQNAERERLESQLRKERAMVETYNLIQVSERRYNVIQLMGWGPNCWMGDTTISDVANYRLVREKPMKYGEAVKLLADLRGAR